MKLIKLLKEFIIDWYNELHKRNLYYKPYNTNIIGEHKEKI